MRYLLDTNIIAEPTKLRSNASVLKALMQHSSEIAISAVSWHELWFGINRIPPSPKRQILETYLNNLTVNGMPILPYTQEAGKWFATERSRLTRLGLTPAYADGQIAAVAYVNNLILVTRNVSDVVHFDELHLENWFD
jgi:tRNA(fMet)-specific endonuclease VapC